MQMPKIAKMFGLSVALAALTLPTYAAETPEAPATPKVRKRKPADPNKPKKPRAAAGTAYVRILHAIPGAPAVDIYLDGQKILTGAAFKSISDYVEVPSGKRAFKITATGQTAALLEDSKTITKDKFYTVAAYGTADKPLFLSQNESTGKEMPEKARVRVYHLSPGAPAVDITYPSTRAADGTASFLKAVEFGKSKAKTVAPATVTLQVRVGDKIIKEMPGVQLEAGKRYSAFAVGTVGGTGDQAFDVIVKAAASK